jgi:hypothetical protein
MKTILGKLFRAVRRWFVPGALALLVLGGVAHLAWKASGSGQWQKVRDEDGVQVFTLKEPGATLL